MRLNSMKYFKKKVEATAVTDDMLLEEIMTRGVADIIPKELFEKKLRFGERMRIYLGVDPTGPTIHIGHAVVLRKLAKLQELGHEIILLIGDFTARIGDPTGKDEMRVKMTHEQVMENAHSYKEQAAKILNFDDKYNPAHLMFNADWLDKLNFAEVMELATNFTVQQMLERDMFENRMKEGRPIYVHEFFYPLMQGYDSVAMEVDGEVGGTDQLFNMLAGRTLLKSLKDKEKFVMTFDLLPGLDGRKMSKSYNNYIGVMDAPTEMYGKVMSLKDELIPEYFLMCTDASVEEVANVRLELEKGENPRNVKMRLAKDIVTLYHSGEAALQAEKEFKAVFQQKESPTDMPEHRVSAAELNIVDLVVETGLASSKSEARRLIEQGGVRYKEEKVGSVDKVVQVDGGEVLQVGKRKFVKLSK